MPVDAFVAGRQLLKAVFDATEELIRINRAQADALIRDVNECRRLANVWRGRGGNAVGCYRRFLLLGIRLVYEPMI